MQDDFSGPKGVDDHVFWTASNDICAMVNLHDLFYVCSHTKISYKGMITPHVQVHGVYQIPMDSHCSIDDPSKHRFPCEWVAHRAFPGAMAARGREAAVNLDTTSCSMRCRR